MVNLDPRPEDAFVESLRALQRACQYCNKHDQAIVLISACIDAGYDTHGRILGALHALGWNLRHAAIVLIKSAGSNPAIHRWQRDDHGVYRNHA